MTVRVGERVGNQPGTLAEDPVVDDRDDGHECVRGWHGALGFMTAPPRLSVVPQHGLVNSR